MDEKKLTYKKLHEEIEKIVRETDSYLNIYKFIRKMKQEIDSGISVAEVSEINEIPEFLVSEISKYDMGELMEVQRKLVNERTEKAKENQRESKIFKHLENIQF